MAPFLLALSVVFGFLLWAAFDLSLLPSHGEICSEANQSEDKDCPVYHMTLVWAWHVSKALNWASPAIIAVATIFIGWFTLRLTSTARRQADITEQQAKLTRIIQRAHIAVNPLGVARFVSGQAVFSCDVGFKNTGHLPATKVRWFIDRMFSDDRYLKDLPIKEERFEGRNVIAPGVEMRKGGQSIESAAFYAARNRPGDTWLYVWGEVRYNNGLGEYRFTKFCFRYNMAGASRDLPREGVPTESARQHVHGNDAD